MATVILKPTEACNANCIYCDVVHKTPRAPATMTLETLEIFFSRVNEFLLERPQEEMEIVWHGGEPLVLGPDYFAQALRFQEKHCAATSHRLRHSMQSNLTLFSRDLAKPLKKLGITSFGTSYDPIGNLRGLGKKRDSQAYNQRFLEALRLVEEEGFTWGIIYVVTRLSLAKPLEIFQFFINLSLKQGVMFNPVLLSDPKLDHLKITPAEYADFLGAIFHIWWRHRDELPAIEPFFSLTKNLLEGNPSLMCCDSGACALSHLSVSPDGSLSHCGRAADLGLLNYGSIHGKSFSQVLADPQRATLLERNTILPQTECHGCRFWPICHGGCPLEAWSASGSFLHKSEWCPAKKDFIENYVEPLVKPDAQKGAGLTPDKTSPAPADKPSELARTGLSRVAPEPDESREPLWINPLGGWGDSLMLAGVLQQVIEQEPSRQFHLVARAKHRQILEGHPAIAHIGHPPPGARVISTNYWDQADYQEPGARAYQILARIFGLSTPVAERLYVPWDLENDPLIMQHIPWQPRNVLLGPGADSPRQQMGLDRWEALAELLRQDQIGVFQAGKKPEPYVRGAYSLLGLTTPRQLISLVRHFDAIVTSDNFAMHAAHLCGTPAVVLWGPTDHQVHGYAGQIHLNARRDCDYAKGCLADRSLSPRDCPHGAGSCLNTLSVETIYRALESLLKKPQARTR